MMPNDDQDGKYPDLVVPHAPEGFKTLKRLPGMSRIAPCIAWGSEYTSWSMRKRLRYAQRLAETMNHAADVIQTERNNLLQILKAKERQLVQAAEANEATSQLLQRQVEDFNKQREEMNQDIVTLDRKVKAQAREIKKLKDGSLD